MPCYMTEAHRFSWYNNIQHNAYTCTAGYQPSSEPTTRSCSHAPGSPGLGPVSLRKEVVVFKEGFRSRTYCLTECAEVCVGVEFDTEGLCICVF